MKFQSLKPIQDNKVNAFNHWAIFATLQMNLLNCLLISAWTCDFSFLQLGNKPWLCQCFATQACQVCYWELVEVDFYVPFTHCLTCFHSFLLFLPLKQNPCVIQAGLEITLWMRIALRMQSSCLHFMWVGIKDVCHNVWLFP